MKKIESKMIKGNNGQQVVLRNVCLEDAEALIQYLKDTCDETPNLTRDGAEIQYSKADEEVFINHILSSEREAMLVAEFGGKIIGTCSINAVSMFKRNLHRCSLGIALYQDCCGQGIGSQMLEYLLTIAKKCKYEQVELNVVVKNEKAIKLYKKMGFEICGTIKHAMKYNDGTYADEYSMIKLL